MSGQKVKTFFKINFLKKFFQEHYPSANSLDPDLYQHSVGPENVGPVTSPNCKGYQRMTVTASMESVTTREDSITLTSILNTIRPYLI